LKAAPVMALPEALEDEAPALLAATRLLPIAPAEPDALKDPPELIEPWLLEEEANEP